MKIFPALILVVFIHNNIYSQNYTALKKTLKKELAFNSNKDGQWVFNDSISQDIEYIKSDLVNIQLPDYEFYKVRLTNFLGYHISNSDCLVLFNEKKSNIILVEPLWYNDISETLLKQFIGLSFPDKSNLMTFLAELKTLMLVGTKGSFEHVLYDDDTIAFDFINTNLKKNEIWRHIEIKTMQNTIVRFKSINPVTKEFKIVE